MANGRIAHKINPAEVERTEDVRLKERVPFCKMLLSEGVRKGLATAGFVLPTIIQATAIPLGKAEMDLLIQSKSGTGKTLIFTTIALELYRKDVVEPQVLIVTPTRELAVQIESVLNEIGRYCRDFCAVSVIGGLDAAGDRKRLQRAKAIVGTPGRILHLIRNDVLNTSQIKLLVLDEADRLYQGSIRHDVLKILKALPAKLQTIACSATFCNNLDKDISKIMRQPLLVSTEERATVLVGIKQFAYELPEQKTSILEMQDKLKALHYIFTTITFKQCVIFAGSQSRADSYRNCLEKEGWPCDLITGAQDQATRLEMFRKFREFKTRILIATDLMARGIDSENVNLVINLELPTDVVTFLHRVGRAGRFGSHGIAVNFVSSAKDRKTFTRLITQVGTGLNVLRFPQKSAAIGDYDFWNFADFEKESEIFGLFGFEAPAPLASGDNVSTTESEEIKAKTVSQSNSSINTKTFCVDSKDSALNMMDLLIDRPLKAQQSHEHLIDSQQSSLQQLPSSNTIDDASSIAADSSIRSNQPDVVLRHSVLLNKIAIPTLVEFLVDPPTEHSSEQAEKKKEPVDIFDDYQEAIRSVEEKLGTNGNGEHKQDQRAEQKQHMDKEPLKCNDIEQEQHKDKEQTPQQEKVYKKIENALYKSLLDAPSEKPKPQKVADIFSEYDKFLTEDDTTESASEPTETKDKDDGTFILSVATPEYTCGSMEELNNSSINASQPSSEIETQSFPANKLYPSPVNNQPTEAPPADARRRQHLTINVAAQIEIPPAPYRNLRHEIVAQGNDDVSSSNRSDDSESSTEGGVVSSGFNEQSTSSISSGFGEHVESARNAESYQTSPSESDDGDNTLEVDEEDEEDDDTENEAASYVVSSSREARRHANRQMQAYSEAQEQWMRMYWNQVNYLQHYVRMATGRGG